MNIETRIKPDNQGKTQFFTVDVNTCLIDVCLFYLFGRVRFVNLNCYGVSTAKWLECQTFVQWGPSLTPDCGGAQG